MLSRHLLCISCALVYSLLFHCHYPLTFWQGKSSSPPLFGRWGSPTFGHYSLVAMAGLGNSPFSVLPSADEIRRINDDEGGAMSSLLAHAGVDVTVGTKLLASLGFEADDHYHIRGA